MAKRHKTRGEDGHTPVEQHAQQGVRGDEQDQDQRDLQCPANDQQLQQALAVARTMNSSNLARPNRACSMARYSGSTAACTR